MPCYDIQSQTVSFPSFSHHVIQYHAFFPSHLCTTPCHSISHHISSLCFLFTPVLSLHAVFPFLRTKVMLSYTTSFLSFSLPFLLTYFPSFSHHPTPFHAIYFPSFLQHVIPYLFTLLRTHVMLFYAISFFSFSHHTIPCHIFPFFLTPFHAIIFFSFLHHSMPFLSFPYHTMPFYCISSFSFPVYSVSQYALL